MLARPLINHILSNEALTRGLADPEARILVEWVVDSAERRADGANEADQPNLVQAVLRRARAIARFVRLWCYTRERGAACQLAAAERFAWPLPTAWAVDPYELMHSILVDEDARAKETMQRR